MQLTCAYHDSIQQFGHSLLLHTSPVPTTTPQPGRVASTLHAPRTSRRWCFRSLASISRLTTTTTQKSVDLGKDPRTLRPRETFLLNQNQVSREIADRLSQSSRLFSLQSKPTESPASNPYSHHVATDKVEGFTPLSAAERSFAHTVSPSGASPLTTQ